MITIEEKINCVLVIEEALIPNAFDIKIELIPNNSTQKNYNIALERIHVLLKQVIDDSVLIGAESVYLFNQALGFKGIVHTFPDEPYDQMIAMCLYTKLSAILRNVFFVDRVSITSIQGHNITHSFDSEHDEDQNILREVIGDSDLDEFVDYWHNTDLNYFVLETNGIKLKEDKWEDFKLNYVDESSKMNNVTRFKPRLVSDNDLDKDNDET